MERPYVNPLSDSAGGSREPANEISGPESVHFGQTRKLWLGTLRKATAPPPGRKILTPNVRVTPDSPGGGGFCIFALSWTKNSNAVQATPQNELKKLFES